MQYKYLTRGLLYSLYLDYPLLSPCRSKGKESACMKETWIQSLGQEDPLEKEMATHSSILAREISWTEEPGSLKGSVGSQRVGCDLATKQQLQVSYQP